MNARHSALLGIASLGFFALGVSACSGAPNDEASGQTDEDLAIESSEAAHARPTTQNAATAGASLTTSAAKPHLTYRGGKVLPSVKIVAVYWGNKVQYTGLLDVYYSNIVKSSYFDWLNEYDTPKQSIGRGSFVRGVTLSPSTSAAHLSDGAIQKELSKQIGSHTLPAPDGVNTLYMVHFPPGVSISGPPGVGDSCKQFCAYHSAFKRSGKMVYYGVHPDFGSGGCENVCGAGTNFDNLTEASSHEMMEAVTDAVPGKGWYDDHNGEVGDICAYQTTWVDGFKVQLEWSQRRGECVAAPAHKGGPF